MRLYLASQKAISIISPTYQTGTRHLSPTLYGHHSCEITEQKITIHLTFFFFFCAGELAAITPDWVGIWKLDVGASGTGQELPSREGAGGGGDMFVFLFFFPFPLLL